MSIAEDLRRAFTEALRWGAGEKPTLDGHTLAVVREKIKDAWNRYQARHPDLVGRTALIHCSAVMNEEMMRTRVVNASFHARIDGENIDLYMTIYSTGIVFGHGADAKPYTFWSEI